MKSKTFIFAYQPKSVEALKLLPEADLKDPFGTAALTLLAMLEYDENPEKAIEMLNFLRGPEPLSVLDHQFLKDRLEGKGYIARSYFVGANIENGYKCDEPLMVTIFDLPYSYEHESYVRLFVKSNGADTPREIMLKQKDNQFFLWENMLMSDVRTPAELEPWL